jgi:hypothetical protein
MKHMSRRLPPRIGATVGAILSLYQILNGATMIRSAIISAAVGAIVYFVLRLFRARWLFVMLWRMRGMKWVAPPLQQLHTAQY